MEQNFQTSFIPKKPMIEERTVSHDSRPMGLFTVVGIFIFFTMLIATGGLYFYKASLVKSVAQMKTSLDLAKNSFEPAQITELGVLDKRLHGAKEILSKHLAVSPIFDALSALTIKTIQYTKFSYSLSTDKNPKVLVKMNGLASWTQGYQAIALQSDIFAQNQSFKSLVIDPVFSNLAPDTKGNILFELDFSVDPKILDYNTMVQATSSNVPDTSSSSGAGTSN